jgi:ferredoxin
MADDGLAEAYVEEVPEDVEDMAKEAEDGCPVSVVHVEDE